MRAPRTRKAAAVVMAAALIPAGNPTIAHAGSAESGERARVLSSSEECFDDATPWYVMRNFKSKKVLQHGASSGNVTKIVQRPENLGRPGYQLWCRIQDGIYESFENVSAQKNIGIDGGSTATGAAAILASPAGHVNQDWRKRSDGYPAGVVALVNRRSGLCLGISGASLNDGAQAAQFPCDGSLNQGWELQPVL